ncbi:MAG: OadG family protein [Desulfohalobiaceae bacterium]|nr:OadG family protein [Desulfohalobiaceae bacterium]
MDKLTTGLQITVIGMSIVFVILILLNLAMNAMNAILNRKKKGPEAAPRVKPAPAPAPVPAKENQVKGEPEKKDENPELIALLSAAVMAAEGGSRPVRIKSLRLAGGLGGAWKTAGKTEGMQPKV